MTLCGYGGPSAAVGQHSKPSSYDSCDQTSFWCCNVRYNFNTHLIADFQYSIPFSCQKLNLEWKYRWGVEHPRCCVRRNIYLDRSATTTPSRRNASLLTLIVNRATVRNRLRRIMFSYRKPNIAMVNIPVVPWAEFRETEHGSGKMRSKRTWAGPEEFGWPRTTDEIAGEMVAERVGK